MKLYIILGIILTILVLLIYRNTRKDDDTIYHPFPNILNTITPKINCLSQETNCNNRLDCELMCKKSNTPFVCSNNKCYEKDKSKISSDIQASLNKKCNRSTGGYLLLSAKHFGGLLHYDCVCLNPMYYNGKYCNEKITSTCENGELYSESEDSIGQVLNHQHCKCPNLTVKCTPIYVDSLVIKPMCLELGQYNILKSMNLVVKI
jgi:hypothetical protein